MCSKVDTAQTTVQALMSMFLCVGICEMLSLGTIFINSFRHAQVSLAFKMFQCTGQISSERRQFEYAFMVPVPHGRNDQKGMSRLVPQGS